jgi:hypothetical protein
MAPPERRTPIVDFHDRIFPGERCCVTSTRVFLGLLGLGKGPRGHEILHHVVVLELVLDGVRMVQVGLLVESLEMVCWWPCLALNTMPGSCDLLHVGVVRLLVIIIIVSRGCNPLRAPLSPLLSAPGVLLSALDGDVGRHHFVATGDGERPNRLLAGGILRGEAEQLLGGVPDDVI